MGGYVLRRGGVPLAALTLFGARGDFARHCGGPIDALDSQVAGSRAVTFDRRIVAADSLARDRFDSDCGRLARSSLMVAPL